MYPIKAEEVSGIIEQMSGETKRELVRGMCGQDYASEEGTFRLHQVLDDKVVLWWWGRELDNLDSCSLDDAVRYILTQTPKVDCGRGHQQDHPLIAAAMMSLSQKVA